MTDPQVLIGRVNDMADTVEVILSNLNAATRGFGSGSGTLGRLARDERLYDNLVAMSRNASELASRMTDTQARVAERLMSLAASFDSLSWRMQHGEGTLAQLHDERRAAPEPRLQHGAHGLGDGGHGGGACSFGS